MNLPKVTADFSHTLSDIVGEMGRSRRLSYATVHHFDDLWRYARERNHTSIEPAESTRCAEDHVMNRDTEIRYGKFTDGTHLGIR